MDKLKCVCCGELGLDYKYDICDICGWQDDNVQNNDPDYEGGANELSLNQAKAKWKNN